MKRGAAVHAPHDIPGAGLRSHARFIAAQALVPVSAVVDVGNDPAYEYQTQGAPHVLTVAGHLHDSYNRIRFWAVLKNGLSVVELHSRYAFCCLVWKGWLGLGYCSIVEDLKLSQTPSLS